MSGKVRVNGEVVLVPQHQVIHNVDNVRGGVLVPARKHRSWFTLRLMFARELLDSICAHLERVLTSLVT